MATFSFIFNLHNPQWQYVLPPELKGRYMPIDVDISLINTIESLELNYDTLETDGISWNSPPPPILPPFCYKTCQCTGPSSGYQIALKYGGLICRIEVTSWGVTYSKSTPTKNDLELVMVKNTPSYQLEMIFL